MSARTSTFHLNIQIASAIDDWSLGHSGLRSQHFTDVVTSRSKETFDYDGKSSCLVSDCVTSEMLS